MGTSWEFLAGDTSEFALKLAFQDDPDQGAGATPEEAASWGAFQLWVGGKNLCAHTEAGEAIESVHWYLLPLLEWFAFNWDAVFHEERLPTRNAEADAASSLHATRFPPSKLEGTSEEGRWFDEWSSWWSRHAIQAARNGGLFPDVTIRRWRDSVEVSWASSRPPGVPRNVGMEFLSPSGVGRFRPEIVARACYQVISHAATELVTRVERTPRLTALCEGIDSLEGEARQDQRRAWLAGLGRTGEEVLDRWRSLRSGLPSLSSDAADLIFGNGNAGIVIDESPPAALLFGAVEPTISEDDIVVLMKLVTEAVRDDEEDVSVLGILGRSEPLPALDEIGGHAKDLVDEVHDRLAIDPERYVDVEEVLKQQGVTVTDLALSDTSLRAVAVAGPRFRPTIAINSSYPWSSQRVVRRFSLAHELGHILFDQSRRRRVVVASGAWAPRDIERRANAFAVAFLMPYPAVAAAIELLPNGIDSPETVARVAKSLGTSASSTLEHLYNLGFIDETEREAIRERLHWSRLTE